MEENERKSQNISDFVVEQKTLLGYILAALFLIFSDPSKASVFFGVIFCTAGEAIRMLTISAHEESDTLITTGIYSYVRNPEYLGNFIIGLGLFLMGDIFIFTVAFVLGYLFIYTERIKIEEEELKETFEEEFEEYSLNVPGLMPRLTSWEESELRFDLGRMIANKEHYLWIAIYALTIIMFLKT